MHLGIVAQELFERFYRFIEVFNRDPDVVETDNLWHVRSNSREGGRKTCSRQVETHSTGEGVAVIRGHQGWFSGGVISVLVSLDKGLCNDT
jgi:hypothetical protein